MIILWASGCNESRFVPLASLLICDVGRASCSIAMGQGLSGSMGFAQFFLGPRICVY